VLRDLGVDFIILFILDSKVIGFLSAIMTERLILSTEQLRIFVPISKQIANALRNAQTFLDIRDREKLAAVGEMAAGLAHEIKNPLGAIKGAAQLLKDDRDNQEFLDIIQDETDRLSSVLSEFLDYAKPRKQYGSVACDVKKVLEHTINLVKRDTEVPIELESPGRKIEIEVDPERVKQVLLNLMINAVQAMENEAEPKLRIILREIRPRRPWLSLGSSVPLHKVWEGWKALRESSQKAFIEIEMQDNGEGISPEEMTKIFVPFYTTKPKGSGLGLSICQRLMEAMGGSIQVRPHRPKGTTFILHLPVKQAEAITTIPTRLQEVTV